MTSNEEKQEFLNLIFEAYETKDKTRLAEWWRAHFPGWKWWLFGPCFSIIVPDDGRIEP